MPNGGDLKKCALASPFFNEIAAILKFFGTRNNLEYSLWNHDTPLFIFGSDNKHGGNIEKLIKLGIEPLFGMDKAIFSIFVTAVSSDRMRFKSWWVAKGVLRRDKERLEEWLEVAHSIFLATKDEDITISMRLDKQEVLKPIFDTAGFLGEGPYCSA